ncbi:hypothetical protein ABBZ27_15575 [Acinetobacter baumannii]|uniref:hypothetical protein n=1 Tax=Acinetobacter baumannii TaxID=470 RepID=UPI0002B9F4FF|nr:hypothetical protein [Acinetobacter baumannii]
MDNYKIKVKDEARANEARDLFKALGYHPDNSSYEPYVEWVAVFEDGSGSFYSHNMNLNECVEITIAQLRDLVVLKRNDSRDANVNQGGEIPCLYDLYLTADRELYFYHCGKGKWLLSNLNHDEDYYATLKPIEKLQPQDPALISGADVPALIKKGESVQFRSVFNVQGGGEWEDLDLERDEEEFSLGDFINTRFEWRIKPQTIKVELEIPAPYKAKIGGRDDTSFVLNVGRHQYLYQNEDDYTKARDALEAVFDEAVRGTNS